MGDIKSSVSFIFVILLSNLYEFVDATDCPSMASSSCECADGMFGKRIICSKLTSELELDRVIRCNNKFHAEEFVIENSELRFINRESFHGSEYELLDIRDTTLMSLTDRMSSALSGLENTLRQITINRCTYTANWNWAQLKDLSKLEAIEVVESDIEYPVGFEKLSMNTLKRILMTKNSQLTTFPKNTFSNLSSLQFLLLSGNAIKTITRSMLPNNLQKLDLSHNEIKVLPAGVFVNLPKLMSLYLGNNKLHTVDEEVFKTIWKQVTLLDFKENPLVCDCRLKWILKETASPKVLDVHCNSPNHLKGISITKVKAGELLC